MAPVSFVALTKWSPKGTPPPHPRNEMRKIDLTNFRLATSETARQINRRIALNFIRRHQPMSRADLRADRPAAHTVSAIVDQLIGEGWVTEGAIGRTPRGRRPRSSPQRRARRHPRGRIRPETTTVGLAGVDARFVGQTDWPTPSSLRISSGSWRHRRRRCSARIRGMLCEGMGVSLPGRVDESGAWCSRRTSAGGQSTSPPPRGRDACRSSSKTPPTPAHSPSSGSDASRTRPASVAVTVSEGIGVGLLAERPAGSRRRSMAAIRPRHPGRIGPALPLREIAAAGDTSPPIRPRERHYRGETDGSAAPSSRARRSSDA